MLNRFSPTGVFEAKEDERGFDLRGVINFVWREWKFILIVVALALLAGMVQLARQTPLYTATAQVLLDPRKEKAAGTDAVLSDVNLDVAAIDSQLAILRSTIFMRRGVEKEGLVSDPEFCAGPART